MTGPVRMRALLATTALALACGLAPVGTQATEEPEHLAIILVVENGGTVQHSESVREAASHLLAEITQLRRHRATRDAEITLILSAAPTQVSWSGTPEQLLMDAEGVLALVEVRPTCSDIVRAWQQAETVLRVTMPDEVRLYSIGPAIQAGFPCDGQTISLPQAVPPEMALARLAEQASVLRLLEVHPDQDEMLLAYLEANGLLERARTGQMQLDILDEARTRARLGNLF